MGKPGQLLATAHALLALACVTATTGTPGASSGVNPSVAGDTTGRLLVPPGYGTLHQDDISLHLDGPGLLVRAIPLDEPVIRLLTPDSYRALRDLRESVRSTIDATVRRYGMRRASVWLVSFYGLHPDARFTPGDLIITSTGRDFRPYDITPLTTGFGQQRLAQRETQSAIFIYDGDVDVEQALVATYQGASDATWEDVLQRIERERTLVRARAAHPR